jgi:hypothetical protein
LSFGGLPILARVDSASRRAGAVVDGRTRYLACSLDPLQVSADEWLRLVRGHWQVENSWHHIKERWWDEDRHYPKQDGVGEGIRVLRNAAVSIRRAAPIFVEDEPIRACADWLGRKIERGIDLFTQTFS